MGNEWEDWSRKSIEYGWWDQGTEGSLWLFTHSTHLPPDYDISNSKTQDYLRRLKFKYLEQEAKLIFLGSITTDEPQTALDDQIDEAERANAVKKGLLKKTKEEVRVVRDEAEEIGRKVEVCKWEKIKEGERECVRWTDMVWNDE